MESACALPIVPFSPNPKPRLSRTIRMKASSSSSSSSFHHSISFAGNSLRPSPVLPAVASPGLASFSCSASLSGSSGSGGGGGGGDELFPSGGGGSGGGGGGGEALGDTTGVSGSGSDSVVILSVGGMSCGGCAASVKRILESQPQVSSASVEFEKEMAVIWVVPEAKALGNWQKELGEKLANQLTSCGFKSHLYEGQAAEGDFQS